MKKVIVIGCPGSGKTTFAEKLRDKTNLTLYYLDAIWHKPDKTHIPREEFDSRIQEIFRTPEWIIDGNYGSTMELRMQACDTVIFLDYPLDVCLNGIKERKGKPRSDLPWIEPDEDDVEFLEFIKNYNSQSRPKVTELLKRYSHKDIYIFVEEALIFLYRAHPTEEQRSCQPSRLQGRGQAHPYPWTFAYTPEAQARKTSLLYL